MKKRAFNILISLAIVLSLAACNRPKVIADRELKNILEEIFISNAYVSSTGDIRLDSMDMYRPILRKYGYEVSDLVYTMANFSKRKSMRLSDVVEDAIKSLEAEDDYLQNRVAVLDTVNARAQRMLSRVVYEDSLIVVKRVSDTTRLRIRIDVEPGGIYDVNYFYVMDSLEENKNLKTTFSFRDSSNHNTGTTTNWMTATKRQVYSTKLMSKEQDRTLEILFGNYPKKNMKKPALEVDSFTLRYYPPVEIALDSVNKILMDYKLMIDGYELGKIPQDSSTLRIHPPRLPEERDNND